VPLEHRQKRHDGPDLPPVDSSLLSHRFMKNCNKETVGLKAYG